MNGLPAAPDPLAQLRAYHLPAEPSWWPPAPGWWLLALLLVLAVVGLAWWLSWHHRRRAATRQALRELNTLRVQHAGGGSAASLARGLSTLLRRYALTVFPRTQVAALSGEAWLRFLDSHADGEHFQRGAGRLLLDAPYLRQPQVSEELVLLVEQWIRRNPVQRNGGGRQ